METNTFKVICNEDLENMVEVYERIMSRDSNGTVKEAQYDIWHHGHRLHCDVETVGEAFAFAAEIALEATTK